MGDLTINTGSVPSFSGQPPKGDAKMAKLHITTKDERTKEMLIDLLHSIKGVEVKEEKSTARNTDDSFQQLCGIWKDRDTTLSGIREKAWQR